MQIVPCFNNLSPYFHILDHYHPMMYMGKETIGINSLQSPPLPVLEGKIHSPSVFRLIPLSGITGSLLAYSSEFCLPLQDELMKSVFTLQ